MQLISIIIPTYNDPDGITTTVKSLINQDYQDNYEVIVVDNNSQDNTRNVVKALIKKNSNKYCQLSLYNQDKIQTSYATRNLGIKKSKGEILCFIDSDMWVDDDYLTKVTQAYLARAEECFYMGCNVEIVMKEGNIYEKYDKLTGFPMERYLNKSHYVGAGCLVVNQETFKKAGLFKENFYSGGDFEFGQRVYEAGIGQFFNKEITIYHPARGSYNEHLVKSERVIKGQFLIFSQKESSFSTRSIRLFYYTIPRFPFVKNSSLNISFFEILIFTFIEFTFRYHAVIKTIIGKSTLSK